MYIYRTYIHIISSAVIKREPRIVSRKINACGKEISERIIDNQEYSVPRIVNNPVRHASSLRAAKPPQKRLRNANASRVL